MTTDYRKTLKAAALFGFVLAGSARAAPPPVEAFGRKPALVDVDINPSGTRLAFIEETSKQSRIVVLDLATGKEMRSIGAAEKAKLWAVKWASDETVLIDESITRVINLDSKSTEEFQRWVAIDASGGPERMMLMRGGDRALVSGATLLRAQSANPGKFYMTSWDYMNTKYRQETGSRLSGRRKDSGWVYNAYEV
ncbi:MAG: hypothetical protein ABUL69_04980, partial [Peristeroidobacter soli]